MVLKHLSTASAVATFVLISIGGLVRATKSGLGCGTDWPDCSGKLLPAIESRAMAIEFAHRAAAGVVVVLLAVFALLALRRYRESPRIALAAVCSFGLVLFQAVLGAVVVKLELEAASVVMHLGTALALLALLIYATTLTRADDRTPPGSDRTLSRWATAAAGATLALLLVGSYVSGTGSGLAFPDWPLMNGRVVPDLGVESNAIHFLHRSLAVVAGVAIAGTVMHAVRRKREAPLGARLAHVAAGAFALEVLIGAANVWTELNPAVVTAHLATGAFIWAVLVALAIVSSPARETVPTARFRSEGAAEAGT